MTEYTYDFAISYAGEDIDRVEPIADLISQYRYKVFFAPKEKFRLVGADAETTFEDVFIKSKQVIVFISKSYREKEWTRFEWDVITARDEENRYIPIKLDGTRIKDLPSNIIYIDFNSHSSEEIVEISVKKLLEFEKNNAIKRLSKYERILEAVREESKGITSMAYQLVRQNKKRKPLDDYKLEENTFSPTYVIVENEDVNFSMVQRQLLKIVLPNELSRDEVIFNLKHCCVNYFNKHKPDAIAVIAYRENDDINSFFTIGKIEFAPYGKWEKAMDGVAYDIPTSNFDFNIELIDDYFK